MSLLPVNNQLAALRQTADIIEEVDEFTTYLGFCKPGAMDGRYENWSIMKISTDSATYPKITEFRWADGKCSFNKSWHNRANYDYYYQRFRV